MAIKRTFKLGVDADEGIKKVDELKKGVEGVDKSAKGAKKGLGGMTGATNKLGVAFKAIGIGLIVTAFMKLKDLFSGNIETARKFEVAGAKISAMFDVLRDRLEPLFMSLSKLFTDPLGSLKTFAKAIKDNLINRVKGLIDTFGALGKVVKGVFTRDMDLLKEGMDEAKTATIQLATGLDEIQQSKVADTFKDITKEIKEETKAAGKLTEALQNVRDGERDMLLVRANANKLIAESRLLAEDDNKSMEERLVALKAAVAEEQRVAALELKIQQEKVDAMQSMIDLGKSSEEDMQALAQERARLVELETASVLKQKRVAAEIGTFTNQIAKEDERIQKEKLKRIELLSRAKELDLEITEELSNKEIDVLIKTEEKKIALDKKTKAEQEKLNNEELETLRVAGLTKEQLEIEQATQKYEKLLALAQKHGQDTTLLTEEFNQQIAAIQDQYDQEELAKQKALDDEKLAQRKEAGQMALSAGQDILSSLSSIAQTNEAKQKKSLDKQLKDGTISQEKYDKSIAKIEDKALKRKKKLAMLDILINTAQGVAGAIRGAMIMPFPLNIAAIATGVASVLAGIASAKAVLSEVPGGDAGGDVAVDTGGGGGDEGGADPSQIGGDLVPNMEAVDQPTLGGGDTTVQAYVVENDISNSQSLQQELELQSTL